MLSTQAIIDQIQSIKKSIDLDYQSIEIYRKATSADLSSSRSLTFLQLIATLQGNVATKQLQITMLQIHLRVI